MSKSNQDPQSKNIDRIREQSRQLVRELDVLKGVYLDTGLTFSQCHVLFELARRPTGLKELAETLLLDKSNTSRTVKKLMQLELVESKKTSADNRQKSFSLTAAGKKALRSTVSLANEQVENAITFLSLEEQETVVEGMKLYADALRHSRLQSEFLIRPIKKADNPQMAQVIRDVMTEFGAVGDGYSIGDAEVDDMYGNYRDKQSCYFVIEHNEQVVGGGGIGPLAGGKKTTCELRKMFFLPEARGIGMGRRLLNQLMNEARSRGFKKCYLETLQRMWRANQLYQKNGFEMLDKPMGKTGHSSCDCYYAMEL